MSGRCRSRSREGVESRAGVRPGRVELFRVAFPARTAYGPTHLLRGVRYLLDGIRWYEKAERREEDAQYEQVYCPTRVLCGARYSHIVWRTRTLGRADARARTHTACRMPLLHTGFH
eukprot:3835011-Rhodomonas_salina.2